MESRLVFLNEMHRKTGKFKRFYLKLLFFIGMTTLNETLHVSNVHTFRSMFSLISTNIKCTYLSVHVFPKLYTYPMYIPFGPCFP